MFVEFFNILRIFSLLSMVKPDSETSWLMKEFRSLVNESNSHWLCVSTISFQNDEISIFDSKLRKT